MTKHHDANPVSTLHVVRRYGPVGGLERYVWELTQALAAAGHPVTVVCARDYSQAHGSVVVHELGDVVRKPRWLAAVQFSRRVRRWLRAHPRTDALIHSHDRMDGHHLTTFHGPPFANILERGWWRRLSLRVWMQLWLERRELCSAAVRAIVPNSQLIGAQLGHYYPEAGPRLSAPIVPGVATAPERPPRPVAQEGGVIGFVGREWKRKGLDLAVEIAAELRRRRPRLELWVAGPDPAEVRHLFAAWKDGFRLLGWRDDVDVYPQLDLLLHPARIEPYGMVVAEAMAARVPVVVSDQSGVAPDVSPDHGAVLRIDAPVAAWAAACERQLQRAALPPPFVRTWEQVTQEYLALYRTLLAEAEKTKAA